MESTSPAAHGRARTHVAVVIAALMLLAAVGVLVAGAVRGNNAVNGQRARSYVAEVRTDDAYFHCLDVQARSLVSPAEEVLLNEPNFPDYVVLLKAVGSWVRLATTPGPSVVQLSLVASSGSGTCRGSVVVARVAGHNGTTGVRTGAGASMAGTGVPVEPPSVPGSPRGAR